MDLKTKTKQKTLKVDFNSPIVSIFTATKWTANWKFLIYDLMLIVTNFWSIIIKKKVFIALKIQNAEKF